jgi:hypothetical protein
MEWSRRFWLTRTDRNAIAMVLIVKAAILASGLVSFEIATNKGVRSLSQLLEIWNRWDGPQYVNVAVQGYGPTGYQRLLLHFFPFYPWLIRLVASLIGDPVASAFLVSTSASLAAGVVLVRLTAIDYSADLAADTLWFLLIFPTGYFLHTDYTESLFSALVIGCFLAARRERWIVAGIVGACASLTHETGLLLALALATEVVHQFWLTRRWNARWLGIGLIPIGFAVYIAINYHVTGDPFAFVGISSEHWTDYPVAPWAGIRSEIDRFAWKNAGDVQMLAIQPLLFLGIGLAGTLAAVRALRPSYAVWMAANWVIFAGQSWDISSPRLTLAMFPLFILIALLARNRCWRAAITVWSLLSMQLFIDRFVQGRWAF